MVRRNVQLRAEIRDLVGFGFKVLVVEISEHKIQSGDASADVFKFVLPAIGKILMANLPIDLSGKKMVDRAALRETVNPGMLASLKFGPEERRALPRASAGEAQELPRDEIAGVRGHQVQETRLLLRVAEGPNGVDLRLSAVHSEKISLVISLSSRMRRNRDASSRSA